MSYFPVGTAIDLIMRTQISTKDNKSGDRVYFEVAQNLSYRGQVVVPAGATVVGEVIRADRNGHFGRKGHLEIRPLYVETAYGPVRLTGRSADDGTSAVAVSVATIVLVSPLGFLIHGTSAHLAPGSTVTAYLADDLRFKVQDPRVQTASIEPDGRTLPERFAPAAFSPGPR